MRPRLFSVWFQSASRQYARLAAVLSFTARQHCPDWDVEVNELPPHGLRAASGSAADAANHYKLQAWAREVALLPSGAQLLLADADTFVTGSLDGVWDQAFDVAYTRRADGCRYPLNAGVIAVRGGVLARAFLDEWVTRDALFLGDVAARRPWRESHGGQNQASLAATLAARAGQTQPIAHVAALPCLRWNCEDSHWGSPGYRFDGALTSLVHVKSALRMAAFSSAHDVHELALMWRALEAEAMRVAA